MIINYARPLDGFAVRFLIRVVRLFLVELINVEKGGGLWKATNRWCLGGESNHWSFNIETAPPRGHQRNHTISNRHG